MAAVLAAIVAGFLAGAVAIYREHRLEQRKLLVASRVMDATFNVARGGIETSLHGDDWEPLNAFPGRDSFLTAWESYKGDLAGHLSWREWKEVELAVSHYFTLVEMKQDDSPKTAEVEEVLEKVKAALEKGRTALHPYCTRSDLRWRSEKRHMRS